MFGIGALLKTSLVWLTVLKWIGGAYLVWLGIQIWRSPAIGIEVRGVGEAQSRLVSVPARRTLRADQSQGASLLRRFSSAVHRSCPKSRRPVRRHGRDVRRDRNRDRGVHRQHGSPPQSMASASRPSLQPGLRRRVHGDRGRAAASQLTMRICLLDQPESSRGPFSGRRLAVRSTAVLSRRALGGRVSREGDFGRTGHSSDTAGLRSLFQSLRWGRGPEHSGHRGRARRWKSMVSPSPARRRNSMSPRVRR